jgi:DNA-directed RNA polymerase I, II, and III subunit RPABC1
MTADGSPRLPPEASRLFRVYKTIGNMLNNRGYMIPKELRELTPSSFVAKYGEHPSRESLTMLVVRLILVLYILQ